MYEVISKLELRGKRIGFEVKDTHGNKHKYSDAKIKQMMQQGEIFDITYNSRGFQFKDKGRTISSLPSIEHKKVSLDKNRKTKIVVDEYTDNALHRHILNSGVLQYNSRDFVQAIIDYCKNKENSRVLSISGLRGTGKTTGILQAINKLSDLNNTVLITIDEAANMDCLDLRNLILSKYKNKKYIFIDEITRIKDLVNNSAFLADNLCMSGKKVILSGTDSLALVKAENAALYHRMININVTHISYEEAKKTANYSLHEYIEMGGLYRADRIKDIDGLRNYIDTAVVSNIMNTLTKNKGITSLLNIDGISIRKLRTIVFRIIYAVVYMNTQKIRPTNAKFIIDLFDYSTSALYNAQNLNTLVCSQIGIDEVIKTNLQEVTSVLNAMQELGLIIKVENLYNKLECNYYITNPSIVNQLLKSIVNILETTNLPKKTNATINAKKGLLFESIVVTHTKRVADKFGNKVYYYHDNTNAEIDLIVEKVTGTSFDDLYLYYEIKMTNDSDTAVVKSQWLNSPIINSNINGKVIGRGIIYGGKSKVFKGFENSQTYPPKNMTLQQIETQNLNIELISAEDYLINTKNKLSILETYYEE